MVNDKIKYAWKGISIELSHPGLLTRFKECYFPDQMKNECIYQYFFYLSYKITPQVVNKIFQFSKSFIKTSN